MRINTKTEKTIANYIEVGDRNEMIAGYHGIGHALSEQYIKNYWADNLRMESEIEVKRYAQDWVARFNNVAIIDQDILTAIIIKHINVRLGARAIRNKINVIKSFGDLMGYSNYFTDSDIELINKHIKIVSEVAFYTQEFYNEIKRELEK